MVPGWLLTLLSETPGGRLDGWTCGRGSRGKEHAAEKVPIKKTSAWKMENMSRFSEMTFSVTAAV